MMDEYQQMLETAGAAGITIVGEKRAAQLMAVVYVYGDESAVYSPKMRADIRWCAKRYGVFGGSVPDREFVEDFRRCVRELESEKRPDWMNEIEKNYSVTFPAYEPYKPPGRIP